jgi:branched-chain amino acid transport system substrate-binding protein
MLLQALKDTGGLSGDLIRDRKAVQVALGQIKNFDGATGKIGFNGTGDPLKCAVVVKIDEKGGFTAHDTVCP